MAKTDPKISGEQVDIFRQLADHVAPLDGDNPPDLDIHIEILGALKHMLREASRRGLSRERIVERMNMCLPSDQKITKRKLDAWCALSKEDHPLPARVIPALIWACGGYTVLLDVLTQPIGLRVIDQDDQIASELGRALVEETTLKRTKRNLLKQLEGDQ